jgi:adenine-specific DNA-methyltransferase
MKTGIAKALRRRMTDAERKLWSVLRNRQLGEYKFRRQAAIGPYIVDFVCFEEKLVIEIDGGQHADNSEKDAIRTERLEADGFQVIRFWNNEVLGNTDGVIRAIEEALRVE